MSKINCTYFLQDYIGITAHHVLSVVVLALLMIFILSAYKGLLPRIGLILILVGGFANLYQRIKFGCVTDYINFFNLFMFNLADLCITIGLVLVFWRVFIHEQKSSHN